jgi:hypothetical protein
LSPLETLLDYARCTCIEHSSIGYSHRAGSAAVGLIVVSALGLVEGGLTGRLLVIGLNATRDTVGGIGETLLDLLLGRLGRVRSDLLLGLCERVWSVNRTGLDDKSLAQTY